MNFKRFVRRKNEEDLWSGWRRTFGASRISQAGELHGITEIGSGRLFIVKPYALGGFSHLPANATAAGLTPGTTGLYTGGVDVKIGLRSNLVANLTGKTDFADSDVDVQQFNLTPYKLFFPEKRQFFLENAGVFAFPMAIGGGADQLFSAARLGSIRSRSRKFESMEEEDSPARLVASKLERWRWTPALPDRTHRRTMRSCA